MVNPLRILGAVGDPLQKRDSTTWSTVVLTSLPFASESTSVTLFGIYTTYIYISGSSTAISTFNQTTATSFSLATSPLITTSSPDPFCSTSYAAGDNFVSNIQQPQPTFQVGFTPACLPTGYYTVAYYSPGICPSGYSLVSQNPISLSILETQGVCCFK
jgi:hypothetical protein